MQLYRDAGNNGWDVEGTLQSMTRTAAEHSLGLERQLREEIVVLRKEVAEDRERQQQEVAGLQATVAAMAAQLQTLLAQSMQQN